MSAPHFFEATSHIFATPDDVWPVLTDVTGWPSWDSGVDRVEGSFALGAKLTITVAANPGRAFAVKVVEVDEPSCIVFRGGMPMGLFVGTRTYTLTPADGGVRFSMREEYSGLLTGMIMKSIPDLNPSFQQFADGLAHRVAQLRAN